MAIYFIIYLFLLAMAMLDFVVKKDKVYNCLFAGFALFVFFLAAFRGMGNDYDGYKEIFETLSTLSINDIFDPRQVYVEPGFATLNILLSSCPYQTILVVMAAANITILFTFFRRYSPYPYVSLLFFAGMFLYTGVMGLIRQHLAIAICMWAMAEPRRPRFWWLVGVAVMFHYSAVFVLLVRILKDRYYTLKTYLTIGGIAIASNLLMYEAFKLAVGFLPAVIAWKLEIYLGAEAGMQFGFNAAVAIRLFTFVLAYTYREQIAACFPRYGALFVNIYFLAIVIYTGFGFLPQVAARGAVYFHYMELLVVPMILYVASGVNRAWIFTLYALFALWRHIEMVTVYAEAYMPYKNVLFT